MAYRNEYMFLGGVVPRDATREELAILNYTVSYIYSKLKDPLDKFIVMALYELGMSKEDVTVAADISMAILNRRIDKIKARFEEMFPDEIDR